MEHGRRLPSEGASGDLMNNVRELARYLLRAYYEESPEIRALRLITWPPGVGADAGVPRCDFSMRSGVAYFDLLNCLLGIPFDYFRVPVAAAVVFDLAAHESDYALLAEWLFKYSTRVFSGDHVSISAWIEEKGKTSNVLVEGNRVSSWDKARLAVYLVDWASSTMDAGMIVETLKSRLPRSVLGTLETSSRVSLNKYLPEDHVKSLIRAFLGRRGNPCNQSDCSGSISSFFLREYKSMLQNSIRVSEDAGLDPGKRPIEVAGRAILESHLRKASGGRMAARGGAYVARIRGAGRVSAAISNPKGTTSPLSKLLATVYENAGCVDRMLLVLPPTTLALIGPIVGVLAERLAGETRVSRGDCRGVVSFDKVSLYTFDVWARSLVPYEDYLEELRNALPG